ncbi:MAG: type I-C CRISPR-associated protein Cas8c/Csd1, partial [Rhodobacteraceae bacterium]|nr:type I-C CRISPR-associated protein Cas8c/Csd1 [Paracoccaceae bacterium]
MTILQELAVLYERRAEDEDWPKPGFSKEKIGAFVLLDNKGSVRDIRSLMAPDDKDKLRPRLMSVPNPVKRTSGITPNTLWDKSAYVLGITETESGPGQKKRTLDEHAEFKRKHLALLECADDKELIAFRNFCYSWTPAQFVNFPDAIPLVDQNMVFMLDDGSYLHELPAARTLLRKNDLGEKVCLVTGQKGSVARLHPSIKGVMDAQPTGASLVSFNKPADTSHGMKQGDNAPVSEEAAFAYSTALNAMLARGSGNSVNVGDDTVVFWADKPEVEWTIDALLSGVDDSAAEVELRAQVKAIAEGKLRANEPLDPNTRMFVLGLTPNSAR